MRVVACSAEILEEIRVRRDAGVVHAAVSEATDLEEAASAFGLAATPSAYKRIEVADARRLLVRILSRDLAYDSPVIPVGDAERLAQAFLKEVCDAGCLLYTNGTFHEPAESLSDRVTRGASWDPVTDATFDTGVLAIGPRGAACVWVEDED